jgi:hypothetical protein
VLEQKKLERGGEKYNSKKPSPKTPFEQGAWILGMTERGGKTIMKKIGRDKRCLNRKNIFPVLKRYISSDSSLVTDESNIYHTAAKLFSEHQTVNHRKGYVIEGVHINNIENAWNHIKRMIQGTYFHLSYHHFDGYLNEYIYRWNKRELSEKSLFDDFIPLVSGKRVTYKELKLRKESKQAA